jgi:glycosyltransferase involved in cell wall biosynthesis
MRIAQIAPLFEAVPPACYGGTERVVSFLTEELIRLGHEVTLFATADSKTAARLVPCCEGPLRANPDCFASIPHHVLQLERVRCLVANFDVLHFHTDCLHYPLTRLLRVPQVTTLHGRLDRSDLRPLFREFEELPVVSISDAQRVPFPRLNWTATIYHGLPIDMLQPVSGTRDYLLFLGRIAPEKGPIRAIQIARRAGRKLIIAAKVDPSDRDYYEAKVRPLIDGRNVEFVGEISDRDKQELLGHAFALLFPIDWPEPFGIVLIEALACGTPVIAWPHGSVPEIIEHGRTGFLVTSVDQAVSALGQIRTLDRALIRQVLESRFTARRMAEEYVLTYRSLAHRARVGAEAVA